MLEPFPSRERFVPQILAPSSLGEPVSLSRAFSERPTLSVEPQKCDVREAGGKTGSLTLKDCDGVEIAKLEWRNGQMVTEGDLEFQGGCDDSTSTS